MTDKDTLTQIYDGKSIEVVRYYELSSDSDVDIEISDMFGKNKIFSTYKIK